MVSPGRGDCQISSTMRVSTHVSCRDRHKAPASTPPFPLSLQDGRCFLALRNSVVTLARGTRQTLPCFLNFNPFFSVFRQRSEEHTSELQSQSNLVCRL